MLGDDYLSGSVIAHTLERHFRITANTALHPGKNLAVSPRMLPCGLTHEGYLVLSSETSLLASLNLRLTGVTRYLAALANQGECSDFPPLLA